MVEAEQDPFTSFLFAVCEVPQHQQPFLRRSFARKFRMAIAGEDHRLSSAFAISIYRAVAATYQFGLTEYTGHLSIPRLSTKEMIEVDLTCPKLAAEHNIAIKDVVKDLGDLTEVEGLQAVAARFHVRIKVYLLKETLQKLLIPSGLPESLTCYLFIHPPFAAALVPKKHCAVMQLSTPQGKMMKRAAFLSKKTLSPPKVDKSLQSEYVACTELLQQLHSINEPLMRYILKAFPWLREVQDKSKFTAFTEELNTILKSMSISDQSSEILALYRQLQALLNAKCEYCASDLIPATLPCGHKLCSECLETMIPIDSMDLDGKTTVPIMCRICRKKMTGDELKSVSPELYAKAIDAVEARCHLRFCAGCKSKHSLATTVVLVCGHRVCGYCQAASCPVCKHPTVPLLSFQCQYCGRDFPYSAAVPYTCINSSTAIAQLRHREYCNNCLILAERSGQCCEHHVLTQEERELITTRAKVVIFDCHKAVGNKRDMVEQQCCSHFLCEECVIMRCTRDNGEICCVECGAILTGDVQHRLTICCVCNRTYGELRLKCGHFLHTDCLSQLMEESCGENCVRCKTCSKYIPPTEVLQQLDHNSQLYADFNAAFGYSFDFVCPKPGGQKHSISDSGLQSYMYQCLCHGEMMCPHCLAPEDDREHICMYVEARKIVDEMLESGHRVCQCPSCLQPEISSENESQECSKCRCYYAPCCSAFYDLIYYHGAQWHRPDCSRKSDQPAIGNTADCPVCKESMHQEPIRLKRPRLIGPGEIINS